MTDATTTGRGRRTARERVVRMSGDEREQAILEAAERILDDKDFSAVTIDDIARGAGLSRPTFYFYFASKQAVLLTLLDRVAHEAGSRSARVLDSLADDPAGAWRQAIEAFVDSFATHRGVSVAVAAAARLSSEPELAALWQTLMGRWIDGTATAIEAERRRGAAIDGPAPRELATVLNQLNERVITADLAAGADPHGSVGTLLHVWLASIYGRVG
jgi:AcrR family transcriptional regulator